VYDGVNPPYRQPTAQEFWNYVVNTGVAHSMEEPPLNVWVPVSYSIDNGPWAGRVYRLGHSTVIYDSEFGCGNRSVSYTGGQDLFTWFDKGVA
jgi:hypothetical protein